MATRAVLWLGGMSGIGKTTAARAIARRHDLWLYSLDSRTYAHAEAMNDPALRMTMDELWIDRSPEEMADDFEGEARTRFGLVREDLAAIPDDGAPLLVEGPQLLPELVQRPAFFVAAAPELQRELLAGRGSLTYGRTRDPALAFRSRARRDELLIERLRKSAAALGFDVIEIADVAEAEPALESAFRPALRHWLARADRGDVASRRRAENHQRLDQWRRYAAREARAADGTIDLACECSRPGCSEVVPVTLRDAHRGPLLAH